MAQAGSSLPLSDEGSHGEDAMAMGNIGPRGRGNGDEMMAEVDEGFYMLPMIEIIVFQLSGKKK